MELRAPRGRRHRGWLVTYVPAGAVGVYATSRGVPGRGDLPRSARKLAALETCVYRVVEVSQPFETLHFFWPGSWARVNLSWRKGFSEFLGWYVNLELPFTVVDDDIETMDLVLDVVIDRDGDWSWKDRDDFAEAIRRGILDEGLTPTLHNTVAGMIAELERRAGPFAAGWPDWRPDPSWSPTLPARLRATGDEWTRG